VLQKASSTNVKKYFIRYSRLKHQSNAFSADELPGRH
jgi:hypothetical protein